MCELNGSMAVCNSRCMKYEFLEYVNTRNCYIIMLLEVFLYIHRSPPPLPNSFLYRL